MEVLFNVGYKIFFMLYQTGYELWEFFSTPIDGTANPVLESFDGMIPLELLFGAALISVLVMALVKFVLP